MIPNYWQEYYCVDEVGQISRKIYRESKEDMLNVLMMNVFFTEEDAKRKAEEAYAKINSLRIGLRNAELTW